MGLKGNYKNGSYTFTAISDISDKDLNNDDLYYFDYQVMSKQELKSLTDENPENFKISFNDYREKLEDIYQ